ncbi:kinase-like domain-containing protein [Gorgonomyces haynaldii]|nr:kinase-like domain-containing protein [Gorgonomyces haynaldii]
METVTEAAEETPERERFQSKSLPRRLPPLALPEAAQPHRKSLLSPNPPAASPFSTSNDSREFSAMDDSTEFSPPVKSTELATGRSEFSPPMTRHRHQSNHDINRQMGRMHDQEFSPPPGRRDITRSRELSLSKGNMTSSPFSMSPKSVPDDQPIDDDEEPQMAKQGEKQLHKISSMMKKIFHTHHDEEAQNSESQEEELARHHRMSSHQSMYENLMHKIFHHPQKRLDSGDEKPLQKTLSLQGLFNRKVDEENPASSVEEIQDGRESVRVQSPEPKSRNSSKEELYDKDLLHRRGHSDQKKMKKISTTRRMRSQSAAVSNTPTTPHMPTVQEKYGRIEEVLGKGAFATVRRARRKSSKDRWYAVKEFRKKRPNETEKDYEKKLIAEFCISSSLKHPNVVETFDLLKDDHGKWCVVMEYLDGGDLHHKINTVGFTGTDEIMCLSKQMFLGIKYLHSIGVVHRDLKPENLILDEGMRILKICDFGVSCVFKTQWEREAHKIHGIVGSTPYIAPEEWIPDIEYLPTKVDVWSSGIIMYGMFSKSLLWQSAQEDDPEYSKYLCRREYGYPPFEVLHVHAKKILLRLLDPNPTTRPEMAEILDDPICEKHIHMCVQGSENNHHNHAHPETS